MECLPECVPALLWQVPVLSFSRAGSPGPAAMLPGKHYRVSSLERSFLCCHSALLTP